jgi:hypothetical protein
MAEKKTAADLAIPYVADAVVIDDEKTKAENAAAEKVAKEAAEKARNAGIAAAVAVSEFVLLSEDKRSAKVFLKGGADGFTMKELPLAEFVVVPEKPAEPVKPIEPVKPPVKPPVEPVKPGAKPPIPEPLVAREHPRPIDQQFPRPPYTRPIIPNPDPPAQPDVKAAPTPAPFPKKNDGRRPR